MLGTMIQRKFMRGIRARFRAFLSRYLAAVFVCLCALGAFSVAPVYAQDEEAGEAAEGEEGEAPPIQAIYLPIKPAFVVNYGGAGRLRYLKVELTVRLNSADAANAVREHLPFVRNNLVMLFAAQTNASVTSQEGKEKILSDAREAIRDILEKETEVPRADVVEVLFTSFIVQK